MIYFIQEAGNPNAPIKIGYTSANPEKRVRELQTGHPAKLAVLASFDGDPAKESALHRQWAHLRLHGEWFKADEKLLVYISEIEEMEPPKVVAEPTRPAPQAVQVTKAIPPPAPKHRSFYDLEEGDRFGLLTFIGAADPGNQYGLPRASLVLVCDCGKQIIVTGEIPRLVMDPQYSYGQIGELLRGQLTSCDMWHCPIVTKEREKAAQEAKRRSADEKEKYDQQMQKLIEKARARAVRSTEDNAT